MAVQKPRISAVRVPKTAELIAGRLRSQIVRGELAEGDTLPPETALTEQFQISRPTLREAFRILESQRLIEIRRGARGGPRVLAPDPGVAATYAGLILQARRATVQDVFTARSVVEAPAITMMDAAPTDEQIAVLRENVSEYDEVAAAEGKDYDPVRLAELSEEFHAGVLAIGGGPTLSLFSGMISDIVLRLNTTVAASTGSVEERVRTDAATVKAHGKLVDLLEAGDLKRADKLWRQHLDDVDAVLRARLPEHDTVLDVLGD